MQSMKEAATAFLANKRVAVTGVSRTPKTHGSNTIYKRLRERGYDVFAVNPNADRGRGRLARYQDLRSIPGGVDAVVIATRPESPRTRCASAPSSASSTSGCTGAPARDSVSAAATEYGRQHGITVIDGGCPLMFGPDRRFRPQGHARRARAGACRSRSEEERSDDEYERATAGAVRRALQRR